MAFCTKCGTEVGDGAAHCTGCGAPMGASVPIAVAPAAVLPAAPQAYAPPVAPQYAPPGSPVMYQQVPMAPAQPNMLVTMFKSLDMGEKVAGVGGLVAAICFFLPWSTGGTSLFDSPYTGGSLVETQTRSGLALSSATSAYWLVLLLAVAAVGLLYFAYNNDLRTRIIVASAHCAIGVYLLHRFFVGEFNQIGWYGAAFGLIAVSVGGFMSIFDLTRRLGGMR